MTEILELPMSVGDPECTVPDSQFVVRFPVSKFSPREFLIESEPETEVA